jgi:hypothetical protein
MISANAAPVAIMTKPAVALNVTSSGPRIIAPPRNSGSADRRRHPAPFVAASQDRCYLMSTRNRNVPILREIEMSPSERARRPVGARGDRSVGSKPRWARAWRPRRHGRGERHAGDRQRRGPRRDGVRPILILIVRPAEIGDGRLMPESASVLARSPPATEEMA